MGFFYIGGSNLYDEYIFKIHAVKIISVVEIIYIIPSCNLKHNHILRIPRILMTYYLFSKYLKNGENIIDIYSMM